MMKKLFVLGIVLAMVMGLAAMAGAYEVGLTATSGAAVSTVIMGDYQTALAGNTGFQPANGTGVDVGVAEIGGGSTLYGGAYDLSHAATTAWDIYVWGAGGLSTASTNISIFLTDDGLQFPAPDGTVTALATTKWQVVDATTGVTLGPVKFTAIAGQESNGVNYTSSISLGNLNIAGTTQATAEHLELEVAPSVVTPEPGSLVALFSGIVGLVGFGIRRRK